MGKERFGRAESPYTRPTGLVGSTPLEDITFRAENQSAGCSCDAKCDALSPDRIELLAQAGVLVAGMTIPEAAAHRQWHLRNHCPADERRHGNDNLIHGAEGDDIISALGDNDDIYGDLGTDTVVLQGLLSDDQVMEWAEQGAQLRLLGFGVTKSLRDTEFLRFSDGSVIATSAVPEPSTYYMALAGIACGGFSMWRRRKRG